MHPKWQLLAAILLTVWVVGPATQSPQKVMQIDKNTLSLVLKRGVLYQSWGPAGTPILRRAAEFEVNLRAVKRPAMEEPEMRYPGLLLERRLGIARPGAEIGPAHDRLSPITLLAPPHNVRFQPAAQGVDPMIAVGENYIVATQDHRIVFLDKAGNELPSKGGLPVNMTATAFFGGFIAPTTGDDAVNYDSINRHLGFPADAPIACDASQPTPTFPCVNEFYDTRTLYDAGSKRFFILSAARHQLWKGDNESNPGGAYDAFARRYIAIAVSKTEDPRDGFHQFMPTLNNYRDWPRMAVNGDVLVVAHNGTEDPAGPVAMVFSVKALRSGQRNPPRFSYFQADLGVPGVVPVTHHGSAGGMTLMLRPGATMRFFAFPQPGDPWKKPPILQTTMQLGEAPSMLRSGAIYRNGRVHFAVAKKITDAVDEVPTRYSVRVVRIPIQATTTALSASTTPSSGFLDSFFGRNATSDAQGDLVSYENPALAVNAKGDMFIGFGRRPVQTDEPLLPEARYTVWYNGEQNQRRSRLLMAGNAHPQKDGVLCSFYSCMDYATAVVDPSDDHSFWTALGYGDATHPSRFRMVIGRITP